MDYHKYNFIIIGYFAKERGTDDWICSSCHQTCFECNGPLETNCIRCNYESLTYKYFFSNNNTCMVDCPSGFLF